MPSWKPDCLKASATLAQISNTTRLLQESHDTHSQLTNESTSRLNASQSRDEASINNKSDQHHHQLLQQQQQQQQSKALSFQNASNKISVYKGYSMVELIRLNSSQFGLTIAGGTDKDSRPRICDLKAGSIAHRSDELQIGDMIMSINGIKTQGLKHEEIIDLIKNAGDSLCLEFEYNLPPWPIHPHHAVRSQTVHIQLEKENNSYGFTIRGGANDEKLKSRPLIVTNIRSGGPADREGTLKIGDRILAINGINVLNASLQEAYSIIKQCKGITLFLIEYDSAIVDSIKNSSGPLLIEIEKSPGSSIGIKLTMAKSSINGKNQILVESVKPASIADRCGAIYVGDQILSIDDVSFEHVTLAEANQILKNCVGEFSRVEILPLSQMIASKYPTTPTHSQNSTTSSSLSNNTTNSNLNVQLNNSSNSSNNNNGNVNINNHNNNTSNLMNTSLNSTNSNTNTLTSTNGVGSGGGVGGMHHHHNGLIMTNGGGGGGGTINQKTSKIKSSHSNRQLPVNNNHQHQHHQVHNNNNNNNNNNNEKTNNNNVTNSSFNTSEMINDKIALAPLNLNSSSASSNGNVVVNSDAAAAARHQQQQNGHHHQSHHFVPIINATTNNTNSAAANTTTTTNASNNSVPITAAKTNNNNNNRLSNGHHHQQQQPHNNNNNNNNNNKTQIKVNHNHHFESCRKASMSSSSRARHSSISSLNSCSASVNSNQVSHSETFDLNLKADDNGTFGFTLQGPSIVMSSNHMNDTLQTIGQYPVIGYIEPNSAAERCSVLQPGDRIISVNGRSLEGMSLEEARQVIKESGYNLKLEIEFDVADTIMLTSGTFQVKLLKKNLDLGIAVTYPRFWKSENYPYICEIKKGSVAYRSGMLQPGDRILFIDNTSVRGKSVNEIYQLLRTNEEIVKLKIKKDENYTEDNADDKFVVYTVELQRNGGPLGITISGSDDLFEPMFVSGLTEGGLAERTNAIHVGDVILAINNVSLRGKSLNEAIELLHNTNDMVTLKISRKLEKQLRLDETIKLQKFQLSHGGLIGNNSNNNSPIVMNVTPTNSNGNNNTLLLNKSTNNHHLQQQQQQQHTFKIPVSISHHHSNNNSNININKDDLLINGSNNHNHNHFENSNSNQMAPGNNNSNDYYKTHQSYLPFPMDMTNFIKQSKGNSNNNGTNNNNSNNNNQHYHHNHQHIMSSEELKKKALSLDSINAVERELDEVLKDLELNSQDLNVQLQENDFQQLQQQQQQQQHPTTANSMTAANSHGNCVELPISIQKSSKNNSVKWAADTIIPNSNSSDRFNSLNNRSTNKIFNSEFVSSKPIERNELFIDDQNLFGGNSKQSTAANNNNNTQRKRQNVVSTYEVCNDCFEDGNDGHSAKFCARHAKQNTSGPATSSDFATNYNYGQSASSNNANSSKYYDDQPQQPPPQLLSTYNHIVTPTKYQQQPQQSNSNNNNITNQAFLILNSADSNPYPTSRTRSVLTQINESVVPDTLIGNNTKPSSSSLAYRSNNISNPNLKSSSSSTTTTNEVKMNMPLQMQNGGQSSGHVISQKVISIGGCGSEVLSTTNNNNNNSRNDRSPSPKSNDNNNRSKSIPTGSKSNGTSGGGGKEEEKLDKLPPVPPSAWSTNSSMRRRNQSYQPPPPQQFNPSVSSNGNHSNSNNSNTNGSSNNNNATINGNGLINANLPRLKRFNPTTRDSNENSNNNNQSSNQQHYQNGGGNNSNIGSSDFSNQHHHQQQQQTDSNSGSASGGSSSFDEDENELSKLNDSPTMMNGKNYDNVSGFRANNDDEDENVGGNDQSNNNNNESESKCEIVLVKDSRLKDFGFSISDSLYKRGAYVNKIRQYSPAEQSQLRPFMQIFRVNNIECSRMDCAQVCKIIACEQLKSNQLRLTVSRKPKCVVLVDESKPSSTIGNGKSWDDHQKSSIHNQFSSASSSSSSSSSRPTAL